MIEITYLNESKQEKTISFPDFSELERAQHSCDISTPDYLKIVRVLIDGQAIDYTGTYGDLYFYLLKQKS
ncbi:DUF4649 domain-containing protein [Streptococcus penaeicida]|uniref:DUF4649 domain-containing protein n=1 Tax=Streptococcus penaeicida TaxID=1765960 RepID=A0A2N8LCK6_9STRE|nr:DUF4649 family protein [Streptococcus penaeicida]PND47890.1 DUF4649 domain-containing protein [Streptococcus penaeicida]